jgi:hypothetical protein
MDMKIPLSLFILIFSFLILLISVPLTESKAEPAWQLRPSLSVSETYNSNIYSSTNETEDFITGIGARLNTSYTGANTELQANYSATLNVYAHHPELNVVTHDGSVNVDMARWFNKFFRDVNISVSEDFTYTPDLRDNYFDAERGGANPLSNYGIRTGRNDSFRNAASINMRFQLSQNQDMNMRYSNILTEFSDPALTDNISNSLSIGASYLIRRDTIYGDLGIRNSTADDVDINSYFITTGLRHMFSPVTQGEISIGGEMIDHETTGNTSSLRGALRFSKTSEFFSYHIGYSRELNTVSGVSTSPVVSQTVYSNITGRHSRQLTSNLGVSYSKNNSLDDVDIKSYNVSAGAAYAIRAWLTVSLSVSHFVQDSEVTSAQDIERNLIMLQVAASWGI